ncbi:MAG: glycosyltransferase family 9 protein [Chthoniobacterales bacterium]
MKSIVAIQLKRIGDLILTLPALEALRKAYPAARISLVIDGDTAGLAPAIRCVDEVLVYKKNALNLRTFSALIFARHDAALDFTGTDRSALLTLLTQATRRVAFQWAEKNAFRSRSYTRFIDSPVRDQHTVDHYLDLLAGVDVAPAPAELHLDLPDSARSHVLDSSYIVIHAGAARAEKYWQPERWAAVIDYCQNEMKLPCVLIGGRSEMEQQAIREIREKTESSFIDMSGKLSLLESAALIADAQLFIGIDSGPSHLAAAAQTPQITLFGSTNPFHWRARHAKSIVLQGGKPNPLTIFDSHSTPGDLNALSTQEVIHAINLLLPIP